MFNKQLRMITVTVGISAAISLFLVYCAVQIIAFLNVRRVLNKIPGPYSKYIIGNINDVFGNKTGNKIKFNISHLN